MAFFNVLIVYWMSRLLSVFLAYYLSVLVVSYFQSIEKVGLGMCAEEGTLCLGLLGHLESLSRCRAVQGVVVSLWVALACPHGSHPLEIP